MTHNPVEALVFRRPRSALRKDSGVKDVIERTLVEKAMAKIDAAEAVFQAQRNTYAHIWFCCWNAFLCLVPLFITGTPLLIMSLSSSGTVWWWISTFVFVYVYLDWVNHRFAARARCYYKIEALDFSNQDLAKGLLVNPERHYAKLVAMQGWCSLRYCHLYPSTDANEILYVKNAHDELMKDPGFALLTEADQVEAVALKAVFTYLEAH